MAFSLVTYPCVSRVLGAENLGKVNYAASIVGYFALLAAACAGDAAYVLVSTDSRNPFAADFS